MSAGSRPGTAWGQRAGLGAGGRGGRGGRRLRRQAVVVAVVAGRGGEQRVLAQGVLPLLGEQGVEGGRRVGGGWSGSGGGGGGSGSGGSGAAGSRRAENAQEQR